MKRTLVNLSLVVALLLVSTSIYSIGTFIAYDPSGTWEVEVQLPDRTEDGTMSISKDEDGEFEVLLEDSNSDETTSLDEVSFDEKAKVMTGEFEEGGYTVTLEMTFDGDEVEGTINAAGLEITFTGEREGK